MGQCRPSYDCPNVRRQCLQVFSSRPNELVLFCYMRSKTCRLRLSAQSLASNPFRHAMVLVHR